LGGLLDHFAHSRRHYTQRVWGLVHADYDYRDVNDLLRPKVKGYVKNVATAPEAVGARDFRRCRDPGPEGGVAFRSSEVCHINILTAEARKQAELLYGLTALAKHIRGT
jgi:hypothetical protein